MFLQSPRAVSSAQRLRPLSCHLSLTVLHYTSLYFARASGSEAELRIVVVSGAGSGQVDAAAAGGDNAAGGNAGLFI